MSTTEIPTVLLNSGNPIPQLGFGVFKVDETETERVVTDAIEAGYRHFDGAKIYGNEAAMGRAIAASGIPREQFFITTKLWGDDQGTDSTGPALEASLVIGARRPAVAGALQQRSITSRTPDGPRNDLNLDPSPPAWPTIFRVSADRTSCGPGS